MGNSETSKLQTPTACSHFSSSVSLTHDKDTRFPGSGLPLPLSAPAWLLAWEAQPEGSVICAGRSLAAVLQHLCIPNLTQQHFLEVPVPKLFWLLAEYKSHIRMHFLGGNH